MRLFHFGTFKSPDDLRKLYGAQGVTQDKNVIAYCRISERSSHTWFVLQHLLSFPNVSNYDGSWTEWARRSSEVHDMAGSTEYQSERRELNGTPVTVASYRVGDQWHCTVANVDPGANVARGGGATRDQAVGEAIAKAAKRLK